jgi:hypothetical protein
MRYNVPKRAAMKRLGRIRNRFFFFFFLVDYGFAITF